MTPKEKAQQLIKKISDEINLKVADLCCILLYWIASAMPFICEFYLFKNK